MAASSPERYRLEQLLGRGGQGHTFRAVDSQTGRRVAVKVIELRSTDGWKPFDLFERECHTLRSLDHPGIPDYLDTYAEEERGRYYLVMELVEGQSLKDMMALGQLLSEPQLWNLLHQALEILDYLHGRRPPVIHRDIKPANLIQRLDGRLSLVDFGGVRVALREEGGSTVVGTFGYMAPEQLHGEARPATDIYALGATLAAMATGIEPDKLPHRGLKLDLEPVMAGSPLRDLLSHMLEPDPDRRPGSVAAVRQLSQRERAGSATPAQQERPKEREESPLADVGGPFAVILRVIGSLGYVGLTVVDVVLMPLFVVMLGAAWAGRPHRLDRLKAKKQAIRRVLRSGRRAMRALSRGKDPYQLKGPEPPPALPPHRGRRGRRRGRR